MDLLELRSSYDQAELQIEVLNSCLQGLLRRCQYSDTGDNFDYLHFKVSIISGILDMFKHYRDHVWKHLHTESTNSLREILFSRHSNSNPATTTLLTPPHTPPHGIQTPPLDNMDWSDEEILVHMVPIPVSPIRDMGDFMLTPPHTPQARRTRDYFGSNLSSVISDMSVSRDL